MSSQANASTDEYKGSGPSRRVVSLGAASIVIAGVAAYWNSFAGAFVYDDVLAITDNPTIRRLWPLTVPLTPPADSGLPVAGRPLVNLSLAFNHAWSGTAIWSYHAVNLAIHLLAALTLFGCVRRTLLQPKLRERFGEISGLIAATVAAWWTVHPLQTESVTYVVQRAESLMGLFYLVTLYSSIRALEAPAGKRWPFLAVASCVCGMATKEVMVSAPLIVWVYDAIFVTGSFGTALRARRGMYAGLATSWLLLIALVWHAGNRGGTAGSDAPMDAWTYLLTQCAALVQYVRLALWPHPLVFDYGLVTASSLREVWAAAAMVLLGMVATLIGIGRRHWFGFCGCWFFAILAPSSSVVPIATETIAEHRMYLPLAAVIVVVVCAASRVGGRARMALFAAGGLALILLTFDRNLDYRSELSLWRDTVVKRPENPRARLNFGVALFQAEKIDEAIRQYRSAIELRPNFASAHDKLARALLDRGELGPAKEHAERALRINPRLADAHASLGSISFREGRFADALQHYENAARLRPEDADVRNNLGTALSSLGRLDDAVREYETAVQLRPDFAVGHFHLGNTLARLGRFTAAAGHYEIALRIQPDYPAARENLARVRALERTRNGPKP